MKSLNKIHAKQIQIHIRKIIYHDEVDFITQMQVWSNRGKLINAIFIKSELNDKNHKILSLDSEKVFDKTQHFLMVKFLEILEK